MPFEASPDGVKVRVKLNPAAARDRMNGVAADENGVAWLTASVTAVPENGRANKALIRMLSKQWRLAKSSIQVIAGGTARRKTLLVVGETDAVLNKLAGWLKDQRPDQG